MRKILCQIITLFSFAILILPNKLYPQTDNYHIDHYTSKQGLPSSTIRDIIQDKEGYLWFATENGVVRYNGYEFQSYSDIHGAAHCIYVDRNSTLWVGSSHGLEKYCSASNNFTDYLPDPSVKGQAAGNDISDIVEDKKGLFWVTTGTGVFNFNKITGKFSPVQYDYDSANGISAGYNFAYVDKDGSLWFASERGLDKYNYESGKILHYWRNPQNNNINMSSVSKYLINGICEDSNGTLWLGTLDGIVEFNKKTDTFRNYVPDPKIRLPYLANQINCFCFDSSGLLWVGTGTGIFTFDTRLKTFTPKFINKSVHDYYIGNSSVQSLYIDHSRTLWAGTLANGIYKVILRKLPYKEYLPGRVNQIVKESNRILWISRGLENWIKFDIKTGQITRTNISRVHLSADQNGNVFYGRNNSPYITKMKNGKLTSYDLLTEISVNSFDKTKGMWYGSLSGGLYYINFKTRKAKKVVETKTYIATICEDSSGSIWAATFAGNIICYNPQSKFVSRYFSDPKNPSSIGGEEIFKIYQDKKGRLWFATNAGLDRFIPSTGTFLHYTGKNGLLGNSVYNILEDDHGNLWLGTDRGISKFSPETNQFKNFDVLKGYTLSHSWNRQAVKTGNGEMFFGRSYGLIGFYPDSIKENNYVPPIVITSCMLFDKPIPFGKEIKLPYNKNFLSFEFAALSYYDPERNQFAYKMEGVDKNWVYSGTRHYASYPNLAPGKYIFRVKGSNNDGIWNENGTYLSIIISPPLWETWWAYISYGFIFLFSLYGLRRYELNRLKLKDKVKMDEAVLKEREETDKMKSRFFANISHEFRTPLTLILGPAEKIISDTSEDIKKDANIIKRNSRRLLQLINQLLYLSKLEAGKLRLEASKGNIVSFVKGVALSFESLSESRDITLELMPEKEYIELYFDRDKMMKILTNIISNAFKFILNEGRITISVKEIENHFVEIVIRDTGIGIAKEEIPKLFDRFYQVDSSHTREYEGTGIGLALTKELVELHHGKIDVESIKADDREEIRGWTEFKLQFLLGREHLLKDEVVNPDETVNEFRINNSDNKLIEDSNQIINKNLRIDDIDGESDKTIILVVEDNYDMRTYIKESFNPDYIIEEAINGEQGVRKAEKIIPDLIVSDMMMPKMDGNELVRILKNDERTSHVPIILLTAKAGYEDKLEGLETGADDYLTKPFDIKELQIRVRNLINIRKKLQEKFSKIEFKPVKDKKLNSLDEKFMTRVNEIIEKHITEEEFTIEDFGKELGMSRMQIHRKLKGLTGKSASRYIRSFRLERAKQMLSKSGQNISEIAYSLGFGSPAYFTRCFKEEFGHPPSELK